MTKMIFAGVFTVSMLVGSALSFADSFTSTFNGSSYPLCETIYSDATCHGK